jgi:hypothetical protein
VLLSWMVAGVSVFDMEREVRRDSLLAAFASMPSQPAMRRERGCFRSSIIERAQAGRRVVLATSSKPCRDEKRETDCSLLLPLSVGWALCTTAYAHKAAIGGYASADDDKTTAGIAGQNPRASADPAKAENFPCLPSAGSSAANACSSTRSTH